MATTIQTLSVRLSTMLRDTVALYSTDGDSYESAVRLRFIHQAQVRLWEFLHNLYFSNLGSSIQGDSKRILPSDIFSSFISKYTGTTTNADPTLIALSNLTRYGVILWAHNNVLNRRITYLENQDSLLLTSSLGFKKATPGNLYCSIVNTDLVFYPNAENKNRSVTVCFVQTPDTSVTTGNIQFHDSLVETILTLAVAEAIAEGGDFGSAENMRNSALQPLMIGASK